MYYIKCGRDFLRRNKSGKYVLTKNKLFADEYDSEWEAKRIIANNISPRDRKNYYVAYIDDNSVKVKQDIKAVAMKVKSSMLENSTPDVTAENSDRIKEIKLEVERIRKFSNSNTERIKTLAESLSDIDKEIVDIQHYIELSDLDDTDGYSIYKMIRGKFRERRKIKNELYILNQIKNCEINDESIDALITIITQVENQKYTPRKLTELFNKNVENLDNKCLA